MSQYTSTKHQQNFVIMNSSPKDKNPLIQLFQTCVNFIVLVKLGKILGRMFVTKWFWGTTDCNSTEKEKNYGGE